MTVKHQQINKNDSRTNQLQSEVLRRMISFLLTAIHSQIVARVFALMNNIAETKASILSYLQIVNILVFSTPGSITLRTG